MIHASEKPFSCEVCQKSFTESGHLKRHEHWWKASLMPILRKTVHWKHIMKMHEMMHTGEKPFSCVKCQKSFSRARNMKNYEIIHTGEKPYSSQYCWKLFSDGTTLKRYEMIHTGEKPFSCKKCKKCFARNSALKRHEKIHYSKKSH